MTDQSDGMDGKDVDGKLGKGVIHGLLKTDPRPKSNGPMDHPRLKSSPNEPEALAKSPKGSPPPPFIPLTTHPASHPAHDIMVVDTNLGKIYARGRASAKPPEGRVQSSPRRRRRL